jgi:hypothetical protein
MLSCIKEWRRKTEICCCKAMEAGELFMARKQNMLEEKKSFVNTWNRTDYRDGC